MFIAVFFTLFLYVIYVVFGDIIVIVSILSFRKIPRFFYLLLVSFMYAYHFSLSQHYLRECSS